MSTISGRLAAHCNEVGILLAEVSRTAQLHPGFRLAGAVSHLARARELLAEEVEALAEGGRREEASSAGRPAAARQDDTPVDGIPQVPSGPTHDRE
jgi:hypothetical protein